MLSKVINHGGACISPSFLLGLNNILLYGYARFCLSIHPSVFVRGWGKGRVGSGSLIVMDFLLG